MVSPANTKNHENYNPLFEKLVIGTPQNSKERLIGMLAYSDYKEEKYLWKEQYRKANSVDMVPSEAVKAFLLAYHDGKLDKLRNDAEEMLYVFAEHYAESVSKEASRQALNDALLKEIRTHNNRNYTGIRKRNASVVTQLEKSYDGWWKAGLKGALGSTIFAFGALIISILFSIANPDTNYGRLVKFVIGQQEFLILHKNDCKLKSANEDCIE